MGITKYLDFQIVTVFFCMKHALFFKHKMEKKGFFLEDTESISIFIGKAQTAAVSGSKAGCAAG